MAKEKLLVEDFKRFGGKHCQTASLKKLFDHHGIELSEEMLLGLGGGIGFIYWYTKKMPSPFIGTRFGKGEEFLSKVCSRLGVRLAVKETGSPRKGLDDLKKILRKGEPAYVFADMAYLPYMALPEVAHFGGHTIVVFGIDEEKNEAYISDRANKALTVGIDDLKKARSSKFPPMPPKNRLLDLELPETILDLKKGIEEGIRDCCNNMLTPPIRNIGLAGMKKWADIVPKWPSQFQNLNLLGCLFNTFVYIEIGGTGGRGFRSMYSQFLREASPILGKKSLDYVAQMFEESGKLWEEIANRSLPESVDSLRRIRELLLEKDKVFLEQEPGALEQMKGTGAQLSSMMQKAVEDLDEAGAKPLLDGMRQKILECRELERIAFEALHAAVEQ